MDYLVKKVLVQNFELIQTIQNNCIDQNIKQIKKSEIKNELSNYLTLSIKIYNESVADDSYKINI